MKPIFNRWEFIAIATGGAIGSIARTTLTNHFVHACATASFGIPPSTAVNLSGTALLASLYLFQHRFKSPLRYLAMVGFCGSFTTVSGFAFETVYRLHAQQWFLAATGLALQLLSAFILVALILKLKPHDS